MAPPKRSRSISFSENTYVDIDVPADEVAAELTDDELIAELAKRGRARLTMAEEMDELRRLVTGRDQIGALALIDRLLATPSDKAKLYADACKQRNEEGRPVI